MVGCNMKKISGLVGGIQKFSIEDGPGIRTTVFLKGCPLSCQWCHNPELIAFRQQHIYTAKKCIQCGACIAACDYAAIAWIQDEIKIDQTKCQHCFLCVDQCYTEALRTVGQVMTVKEVMDVVAADKGYYDRTKGGMTISGGELLSQPRFTEALLDAAIKRNIDVALDTSGYGNSQDLCRLANKANWILFDMKCIDDEIHQKVTGVSNSKIINNLRMLAENPKIRTKIIMRMPLIQGINDLDEIILKTAKLYSECHLKYVTLLPYHELGVSKYRSLYSVDGKVFKPPDDDRLNDIKMCFEEYGIATVILGEDTK